MNSILDSVVTAGTIYGWRIDALAIGSLLWALSLGCARIRLAVA